MKNLVLSKLQTLSLNDNLPHAWLFVGSDNNLKLQVAKDFSQWLLCANKNSEYSCGSCKQCHLFISGNHPDFCLITPQEDSSSILIDDVRNLNNFVTAKPQFGSKKIVLLYPAEKMNNRASNSLLKILEEPGDDTILILLASHQDLLLKTIVSRCQIMQFKSMPNQIIAEQDIIVKILEDLNTLWISKTSNPIQLVAKWVKQFPNEVLYCLELVLSNLLVYKYTQEPALLKYSDLYAGQIELSNTVSVSKLWDALDKLQQARNWIGSGYNPNVQLTLENVVI